MSGMTQEVADQIYERICTCLKIRNPPKLAVISPLKFSRNTWGIRHEGEIFIPEDLPVEQLERVLIHEITHEVLASAGYKSIGHGGPFLATYQVFLNQLGNTNDSIEFCARDNWSKWVLWTVWYRHVLGASKLVASFEQEFTDNAEIHAELIAKWMHENWPLPKWLKPQCLFCTLQYQYHNVIADRRAILLLTRFVAISLSVIGFVLVVFFKYALATKVGLIMLGIGVALLGIIGWIRKIRRDIHPSLQ